MKSKLILAAFAAILTYAPAKAQDDPEKALKTAGRAFTSYNMDPTANAAKLEEAKTNIDFATSKEVTAAMSKTWVTKGQIYGKMAENDDLQRMIKADTKPKNPNAPIEAYRGFKKGFELAQKKWEKSDAITGMIEQLSRLRNAGADRYSEKNYKDAYEAFSALTVGHKMVKDFGEKSPIEDKDINTFNYYAALCAQQADMKPEATTLFKALAAAKHPEASIYESLYALTSETDETAALGYLNDGIAAFPKYSPLVFAQINYYLKKGELDKLMAKLDEAIALEPNNIALYTTKGSVLNSLYQSEMKNKNETQAAVYYGKAFALFNDVAAKDPKNFDAQYSLGELVYNKAAEVSKELIAIQDDNSKEGQKKYDTLKAKMDGLFAEALPYFQKAEEIDGKDYNTLVALKEIYVRTKQYDKSKICKEKIEAMSKKN